MDASITLAVLVTLIFALLGTAKIMALPPMRHLAAEAGFSVDAYRRMASWRSPAPSSPTSGKDTGRASTRPPSSAAFSSPATSPALKGAIA